MSFCSVSRSSVKSSTTFMSLENVMMAIRSDGVICVLRNFCAAVCARIWSWIGMEVMSKNITSRRRSLYLMSPGFAGAIWLAVTAFTAGASGLGVGGGWPAAGCGPRGVRAGSGSAVSSSPGTGRS